jgi:hypothetical protein
MLAGRKRARIDDLVAQITIRRDPEKLMTLLIRIAERAKWRFLVEEMSAISQIKANRNLRCPIESFGY